MDTEIISLRLGAEENDGERMRHWIKLVRKEPKSGKPKIDAFRKLIDRDMKRGDDAEK